MEKIYVVVATEHNFENIRPVMVLGTYTKKEYAVKRLKDKVEEIYEKKLLTEKNFDILCETDDFFSAVRFDERGFETGDNVIYTIEESQINM